MSNSSAGLEFLEDVNINILHALCKKGYEFIKAEKVAANVREAIFINLSGRNYIPNYRGLSGQSRRDQVIDLHNEGKKVWEIIRLTGLASSSVYGYIRDGNKTDSEPVEQSGSNTTLKVIKVHVAKALLQNGVESVICKEIVEALCIFLQKHWCGIIFTFQGAIITKQEIAQKVYEDYKSGVSRADLAIKYSLGKKVVDSIIGRHNN